jgi:hypothetical protein
MSGVDADRDGENPLDAGVSGRMGDDVVEIAAREDVGAAAGRGGAAGEEEKEEEASPCQNGLF